MGHTIDWKNLIIKQKLLCNMPTHITQQLAFQVQDTLNKAFSPEYTLSLWLAKQERVLTLSESVAERGGVKQKQISPHPQNMEEEGRMYTVIAGRWQPLFSTAIAAPS